MNALRAEYFDSLGRFLVKKRKPNVRKLKVVIGWQIEFSPNVLARVLLVVIFPKPLRLTVLLKTLCSSLLLLEEARLTV